MLLSKFRTSAYTCSLRLAYLLLVLAFGSGSNAQEAIDGQLEIDNELRQALLLAVESSESFVDKYDAEVWLVSKSGTLEQFIENHDTRLDLLRLIHGEATRAELDPNVVLAVIEVESRFDKFAISVAGAQGLMQVMPFWKEEIGRADDNLTDIPTNLRYGCTILRHYLEKEDGNLRLALARYNGSVGQNWYPELVFNAWDQWR